MARKLGVRTPLDVNGTYVPAMGLGSIAVSPLDMASAYATLAAGGIYSEPTAIRRVILPDGTEDKEADWGKPRRKRVIPDGVASVVTEILEDNVLYGTGTRAGFGRPGGGQDRYDRRARRRVVRRLHPGARDGRLDRVHAR